MIIKIKDVRKIIRVGAFALGLAFITVLPTTAQQGANSNTNRTETTRTVERENSFPWGLLGLLGLAGLIPQKRQVEVHQARDTDTHRPASGTKNNS